MCVRTRNLCCGSRSPSDDPLHPSSAQVGHTFLNNTMTISLLFGVVLDNILPGTDKERGLEAYAVSRDVDVRSWRTYNPT